MKLFILLLFTFSAWAADTSSPSTPTDLTAIAVSSSQIDLKWGASHDSVKVSGYRIFRNKVFITRTQSTNFNNTRLADNTVYTYQVQAFDAAGNNSQKSNSASATTSGTSEPPPQPTDWDTEFLGQSQTTQWGPYFILPGFQFRIRTGSGYMDWLDPTDTIWTQPEKLYSSDNTATVAYPDIERVILTIGKSPQDVGIAGTYESLLDQIITTIRSKYLNVQEIVLQPLAAGPNKGICSISKTNVLTTVNLPAIETAIQALTSKYADVKKGSVPLVDNCNEFADSTGHLTDPTGRKDIADKVTAYYQE